MLLPKACSLSSSFPYRFLDYSILSGTLRATFTAWSAVGFVWTPQTTLIRRESSFLRSWAPSEDDDGPSSRRDFILQSLLMSGLTAATPALASVAEIDETGNLFSPKSDMITGGSQLVRGIPIRRRPPGDQQQTSVYDTRFIQYLARFLLNFDSTSRGYFYNRGLAFSWDQPNTLESQFFVAEFAESVEVGLNDYFSGNFGTLDQNAEQGILNLYAILKARYTSVSALRQLAILFSFLEDAQPVNEIRGLIGEADNATVTEIELIKTSSRLRASPRQGGGYSINDPPIITVESPPPLGDRFRPTIAKATMQPTSRILRITLQDGGTGYTSIPNVVVTQRYTQKACQAVAILNRVGNVESIIVLDPGLGYGGRNGSTPPTVRVDAPRNGRPAVATAELEYEITGVEIVDGGNGYVCTEPPEVTVTLPDEDPDWYVDIPWRGTPRPFTARVSEMRFADRNYAYSINQAIRVASSNISKDILERLKRDPLELLPSSVRPTLALDADTGEFSYQIPELSDIPQNVAVISPRYKAYDPVFGGVGRLPVTKGATALTPSEYTRLAISGAVCTVIVRTLLNPLELVKTKQQLLNDKELINYVASKRIRADALPNKTLDSVHAAKEAHTITQVEAGEMPSQIGTGETIQAILDRRGIAGLFQSADITFLASLVFGSFGFGATELFRRSFAESFVSSDGSGSELVLLLAASLATVLTAAVASPFEVLRVRSMGLIEPTRWMDVLDEVTGTSGSNRSVQSLLPLFSGFAPILSRELPFAVTKFFTFDLVSGYFVTTINSQIGEESLPVAVGVGTVGLTISAIAGAVAGVAGACVSHPADLILTKISADSKQTDSDTASNSGPRWVSVVRDLLAQDGGIANLFVGLGSRCIFFFLVIGLQFFLYDFVKNIFRVGSDDLSLVLDVFYAVRAGLVSEIVFN